MIGWKNPSFGESQGFIWLTNRRTYWQGQVQEELVTGQQSNAMGLLNIYINKARNPQSWELMSSFFDWIGWTDFIGNGQETQNCDWLTDWLTRWNVGFKWNQAWH